MAIVSIHLGAVSTVYEIGTQYIESGATLTLGNPTNVNIASSAFDAPGVYILFKIESGATFDSNTVNRIVIGANKPAARTIVQVVPGQDAYWDAATSTVRVRLA